MRRIPRIAIESRRAVAVFFGEYALAGALSAALPEGNEGPSVRGGERAVESFEGTEIDLSALCK